MGVIIPGDFKVVHIKRDFTLNVFVLTKFHCIIHYSKNLNPGNTSLKAWNSNCLHLCGCTDTPSSECIAIQRETEVHCIIKKYISLELLQCK